MHLFQLNEEGEGGGSAPQNPAVNLHFSCDCISLYCDGVECALMNEFPDSFIAKSSCLTFSMYTLFDAPPHQRQQAIKTLRQLVDRVCEPQAT